MKNLRLSRFASLALALVAVVTLALPQLAEAGCLQEHSDCVGCARGALKKSIMRLDLAGIRDANVALWDCDIDLYHCIVLGKHHTTACAL